jgi:adenosylmethionine-8-amino-7-oxononanoate aminotransferase
MDPERSRRLQFIPSEGRPPLAIARAEGAYLIQPDGRRILDAAGGAIVVNIGHGRRELAEVAAASMERMDYVVPPFATEQRLRLVERLLDHWLPRGLTRVFFANGGSEALDAVLRLVRKHHLAAGRPERWKIIGRELSYHGTTVGTLAIGGHEKRKVGFEPLLVEHPKAPACFCKRCPLGQSYPECAVACADEIERVIEREGADTVAAFIAEPIGGSTAGALVPPDEYWPRVAEICRRHGVLLIADEVMTGYGRTGKRFGVDHWNITPDILVGGKGLTGGYAALVAIAAREEVVEPLAGDADALMFYTYSGQSVSCAVADRVLEIIEREELVERAAEMGARLRQRLEALEDHPNVAEVRGRGLLLAVELVRDRETLEPFPKEANLTARTVGAGLRNGVYFYPGGCDPARDVITLGPPFIIGDEEIELIGKTLEVSITQAVERATGRA